MEIGRSAAKSYAYLLGVFLGDGCITSLGRKIVFKLNTIDEDFAFATKNAFDIFNAKSKIYTYSVKKSSKPNHQLICECDEIIERLNNDTQRKLILPVSKNDELDIRKQVIIGLMDSEGFVAGNKSNPTNRKYYMGYKSCDPWVDDLISIMQSVGLKLGKRQTEKPRLPHYKAPTRFHIKMQSWIDSGLKFNIKRKQDRVDEWASIGPYEMRSLNPRKLSSTTNTLDLERG